MEDLVVTVNCLLDELNVSNDKCGRTDHLFQVESWQELGGILNEYTGNDREDADSTNWTKMLQLIDNVLPCDPPSRINGSPGMEMLTATMTKEDVAMEEDAADSDDPVEPDVLQDIYKEEVSNEADDLIDDAPSSSNATQDTQLK